LKAFAVRKRGKEKPGIFAATDDFEALTLNSLQAPDFEERQSRTLGSTSEKREHQALAPPQDAKHPLSDQNLKALS
jgi:hypothetical protein